MLYQKICKSGFRESDGSERYLSVFFSFMYSNIRQVFFASFPNVLFPRWELETSPYSHSSRRCQNSFTIPLDTIVKYEYTKSNLHFVLSLALRTKKGQDEEKKRKER